MFVLGGVFPFLSVLITGALVEPRPSKLNVQPEDDDPLRNERVIHGQLVGMVCGLIFGAVLVLFALIAMSGVIEPATFDQALLLDNPLNFLAAVITMGIILFLLTLITGILGGLLGTTNIMRSVVKS